MYYVMKTPGEHSIMSGLNLEDLKKHIQKGSEAVLASINPFGAQYREKEHMKTLLSTMLLIEYSVLTISMVISVVLYGATATLGALITRLTLNWAQLKNKKRPRTDPIQLERLMTNAGDI